MLLQELVVRTPLTSVARLLSAHQFTSVLRDTMLWLQKRVTRVTLSPDLGVRNKDLWIFPEDSSDTAKSSSNEDRSSKKRKLDGTEVAISEEAVSTAPGAFKILYLAMCGTIRQLELLTIDPEQIQGFAAEHMKSSLRCSPEDAAHILGNSFYFTNLFMHTTQKYMHQRGIYSPTIQKVLADTGCRSCILPMIDLWNRRSVKGQHPSTQSNVRNTKQSSWKTC